MPGTTSTALPSFSHDQHHETDAAKWKGGGVTYVQIVWLSMDWPCWRHNGLLHEIIEGRMKGKPRRGRRRIQMLHDLAMLHSKGSWGQRDMETQIKNVKNLVYTVQQKTTDDKLISVSYVGCQSLSVPPLGAPLRQRTKSRSVISYHWAAWTRFWLHEQAYSTMTATTE